MPRKNKTIVITGPGRCGTSAIAGMLHETMGIPVTIKLEDRDASFSSAKGMWEDIAVQNMNMSILRQAKAPEWWYDIPDPEKVLKVGKDPSYITYVKKLIKKRDEKFGTWGMKDPRFCSTYPIIHPHLINPHVIFCGRCMEESVRSMLDVFKKVSYTKMLGQPIDPFSFWATVTVRFLDYVFSLPDPLLILGFEEMMQKPEEVAKRVAKFVGVKYTEEAGDWIDPGLRTFNKEE